MPKRKELRLLRRIFRSYRKKGYGKKRAKRIANAVVFGRRRRRKR